VIYRQDSGVVTALSPARRFGFTERAHLASEGCYGMLLALGSSTLAPSHELHQGCRF
jgi:hypothetical protein